MNKQILWLSDFSLCNRLGGSQATDSLLINYGNKFYDIIHIDSQKDIPRFSSSQIDAVITGNITLISQKYTGLLTFLQQNTHIRLEHDHCPFLGSEFRQGLFESSCKNIFLSTEHLESFQRLYGDIFFNTAIINDPVDVNTFFDFNQPREDKTLWVGDWQPHKGTELLLRTIVANPNRQFVLCLIGGPYGLPYKNVEIIRNIPFTEMPSLYNKYTDFIFFKIGNSLSPMEPFCRTVAEAILSGMKVEVSGNVGSYELFKRVGLDKFKELCNTAPERFWQEVQSCI